MITQVTPLLVFCDTLPLAAITTRNVLANCSNSWSRSYPFHLHASLNWDATSHMDIVKQIIPQNNLFRLS